ncbi:MAG TPA: glutaredoxin family protein [Candidatus Brocadiaceae bacterium]|nr:glutaredoxin family protein [Candidatus Brocadiaceae bacterium]
MATKLKVFCTPFCPKCSQLLTYLNKKKVDYISYDIDKDDNARKEAVKIVGTDDIESLDKLPIVVVGDKVLYGFDKKEIDKYIR